MRVVHRIIQSLSFAPALAGIGIASPAASPAQGPASISIIPAKVMAGSVATIDVKFKGQCSGGLISFGDGSVDHTISGGPTVLGTPVQHVYAKGGTYQVQTYLNPVSPANSADLKQNYTANCKGGPVTLLVAAKGSTGTAGATPPAPSAPPGTGPVTCNDGTVINNRGTHVCDNHGGFKPAPSPPPSAGGVMCNDGTQSNTNGKGACKDHHGILEPLPQPCKDGTMSNNTADNACDNHGGFKKGKGTANTPPAPPPASNTNTTGTGVMCNDGTTSNTTGKGACAHHGGIKKDSTANAPPERN